MTSLRQDIVYQYSDGRDLLSAFLIERSQLLRELEMLARQGQVSAEIITDFDLAKAQTLLFDLSLLTERIDDLVVQINDYAGRCGKPRVEITKTKLK